MSDIISKYITLADTMADTMDRIEYLKVYIKYTSEELDFVTIKAVDAYSVMNADNDIARIRLLNLRIQLATARQATLYARKLKAIVELIALEEQEKGG